MIFLNNQWYYGNREIKYTETIIHKDCCELLTYLTNFPDTNDLNINIECIDEDHFKVSGEITPMLLFIYNHVLKYKDYTLSDILSNQKELDLNTDIYFQKVW